MIGHGGSIPPTRPSNCGFPDGVVHAHSGRCYEAGRREAAEAAAHVDEHATDAEDVTLADVVAELRTIRGLLEQQGMCPHGNTGICMYCIQPTFDAIELAVKAAVRR